jgi:large subunit ribosomal protein L13
MVAAERDFMSTFIPERGETVRRWHVIDAANLPVGRVASLAARLLQGKHKAIYTPFLDLGDHVIVVNVAKSKLTGKKEEQKLYRYHSGYDGGLRVERAKDVRARHPRRLMEEAVRGMLPKSKLGHAMYRKLNVYEGAEHPHAAQTPTRIEVA